VRTVIQSEKFLLVVYKYNILKLQLHILQGHSLHHLN